MSKFCPNCGKELPDDSKFCLECGYSLSKKTAPVKSTGIDSNLLTSGNIFLVIIVIILIIGGLVILTSGNGSNDSSSSIHSGDVSLTISDVSGWSSQHDNNTTSYTYYVEALFTKVPSNKDGYIVKTIYCDANNTEIGNTVESLSQIYHKSDYSLSFGTYTTYKQVKVDNVKVQIIKDGNVSDEFTAKVDQNKLNF